MKRSIHLFVLVLALAVSMWPSPVQSATTVQVYFQPSDVFVAPHSDFAIDLRANITADPSETLDPVLLWDLWLDFDQNALALTNSIYGNDWYSTDPNPSDSELFAASETFPSGVSGENVLLATLYFQFIGDDPASIGIDPLQPNYFIGVSNQELATGFGNATIYPVPLPGSIMLLSFGLVGLVLYRGRSR